MMTMTPVTVLLYFKTRTKNLNKDHLNKKKLWWLQCCPVNNACALLTGQRCVFVNVKWCDLDQSSAGILCWGIIINNNGQSNLATFSVELWKLTINH